MHPPVRRAAVLGAGVMGQGIAAHLANAGVQVLLLDIVPKDAGPGPASRNKVAAEALGKAIKSKPALFFHPGRAELVTVGNLEDDLAAAAKTDLVIEAVVERMDIKQGLFSKLEPLLGPQTIVASNTSGLGITGMLEGRSASFKQRFLVMHFFNPVRYMKLLELVPGKETDAKVLDRVRRFGEDMLGKGVIVGKDTPNFIANRIGTHALLGAVHEMLDFDLTFEDVDLLTGTVIGHPKSANFRTADIVGLDTLIHVADNCYATLASDDARDVFKVPEFFRDMAKKGILGDKTKGGFYKKVKDDIQTLNRTTLEYGPKGGDPEIKKLVKGIAKDEDLGSRLRKLAADTSKGGQFLWKSVTKNLIYSAKQATAIADSIADVDAGMRWGYNWEMGPFETWDAMGFEATAARLEKESVALPPSIVAMRAAKATGFYRDDGAVWDLAKNAYVPRKADPRNATWTILKKGSSAVIKTAGAEAWDLGDGILGLQFKSKANSIDADVVKSIYVACDTAETDFRGLLLFNAGEHFCVGANLFLVVMAAGQKDWTSIRTIVNAFQGATQRMKYATVPVVTAPFGMTLGGGLELCYGSDASQAAAETYSGLVEVGVGLVPGGGGCLNMLWRSLSSVPEGMTVNTYDHVTQVFKNIALADVQTSAEAAQRRGYLRMSDGVSFDRSRQLTEAKSRCMGLADAGYHAPMPRKFVLPGENGIATLQMMVETLKAGGFASEHDAKIAMHVARILCGGAAGSSREMTESEILELECEAFLSLCGEEKSQQRMQHMLMQNKPLRN